MVKIGLPSGKVRFTCAEFQTMHAGLSGATRTGLSTPRSIAGEPSHFLTGASAALTEGNAHASDPTHTKRPSVEK